MAPTAVASPDKGSGGARCAASAEPSTTPSEAPQQAPQQASQETPLEKRLEQGPETASESLLLGARSEKGRGGPDRPRERLSRLGAAALSDAELVALFLRTGNCRHDAWTLARALVERFDGLDGLLSASGPAIESIPGLGPAKSASLLAAAELARRLANQPLIAGRSIRGPGDVQAYFQSRLRHLRRESFHVILLNGRHRLISVEEISIGTLTASLVHPREVFRDAIRCAAGSLLLVHNHPSGDPSPSPEDRAVTARLRAAGDLMGIPVVDHVIVSEGGYFSFREAGEEALIGAPQGLPASFGGRDR